MYPEGVSRTTVQHRKEYGYIMRMGSHVFFNGMAVGETNKINIEDGKTLVIKYLGLGDRNDDGTRTVQFELNGMRREVAVPDPSAADTAKTGRAWPIPRTRARWAPPSPAWCRKVNVKPGDAGEGEPGARRHRGHEDGDQRRRPHGRASWTRSSSRPAPSVKAGELLLTIK